MRPQHLQRLLHGHGECLSGGKRDACGSGGQACTDCGAQACVSQGFGYPPKYACGACGSGCDPFPDPQYPVCQSDGCGKPCPGSGCDQTYGPAECMIGKDGYGQCNPTDFCDPFMCDSGCCDYSSGWGGKCVTGNLPSARGTGGIQCIDCVAKGGSCNVSTQTCTNCTPDCSNTYSCGQGDGCGGICTGTKGGKCGSYPGTSCNDEGQCKCQNDGELTCYDQTTKKYECRDTLSDANNCGGCDITCPTGKACVNGTCQCPAGSLFCKSGTAGDPGVCTNLGNDQNNCGLCNNKCPGTTCTDGKCAACPPAPRSAVTKIRCAPISRPTPTTAASA